MALISLNEIFLAFGGPPVFDRVSLQLEPGERVALLGRNGTGKTTLMKVMAGQIEVSGGQVILQKGVQIAHLPQEVPRQIQGTVFDIVFSGLGARAKLLSDYHHVLHRLHTHQSAQLLQELDRLQAGLDHTHGWDLDAQVKDVLLHMKLDGSDDFQALSGGRKRRVLLAKALVLKPEILLLDEPTNHLDIDTIDWLEGFLKDYPGTIFFVTHDRRFMTNLSTRIMELDRGKIIHWACDYPTFLRRKQESLEIEAAQRSVFDKKLAEEEAWIRQGIKARRTRNEGRVRALERMREEKRARRERIGRARIQSQDAGASGRLVIKAEHVSFRYGTQPVIRDFSTQIMRGDRIGVIGANGSGKTTLLRVLLGEAVPDEGIIRLGTNLEVLYYDQLREQLDEDRTVIENVTGGGGAVMINGKPRPAIGYLQDFLFTPDRARTPIRVLSGGERNRVFLARLFARPSNLLVMDEPTNDLDIETQELLEELLMEYAGTLILVSHDRVFLNHVVTSTIVVEGDGCVYEYAGGYDDWLSQRQKNRPQGSVPGVKTRARAPEKSGASRGLSFQEKKELARVPDRIQGLEDEQQNILALMGEPDFYRRSPGEISRVRDRAQVVADELSRLYQRWEELEMYQRGRTGQA